MPSSPEQNVPWRLRPLSQDELPRTIFIPEGGLTVGRDSDNVLVLSGTRYPGVSSFHCKVSVSAGELVVEDLGSKNSTLVDGEPVERTALRAGSILTLGRGGPRFAVLGAELGGETLLINPARSRRRRRMGSDTVKFVRAQLGISDGQGVEEMLGTQRRRTYRLVGTMGVILILGFAVTIWAFNQIGAEAMAEMQESFRRDLANQRDAWLAESDALQKSWQVRREQLARDRADLEASVRELQAGEIASSGALQEVQDKLESTTRILESYNPVNLENDKLEDVQRVANAVVMVEVRRAFWEESSARALRGVGGMGELPPVRASSGSGVCISADGWIITNAHVALQDGEEETLTLGSRTFLSDISDIELTVIFSNTRERHVARLEDWRSEGRDDLALLKIEPFPDMPFLPDLDVDEPSRPEGTEVFLIGFPLGKRAMQEEDKVIASTFRGIISRYVDPFMFVDAAVHPGASGGPLIDGDGDLLGIVVGMQATDDYGGASSAMGVIIPVGELASLWPPRR